MGRKDLESLKPSKPVDGLTRETVEARYAGRREKDETLPQGVDLVEAKIRMAVEQGELDNLPGSGKPLDLGTYFDAPEHLRVAYHMLKSAGFVPEEVRLSKEMEELRERLRACGSEEERQALRKRLCDATQRFNECIEYNRKLGKSLY